MTIFSSPGAISGHCLKFNLANLARTFCFKRTGAVFTYWIERGDRAMHLTKSPRFAFDV